jgi:hypothetical protein
MMSSEEKPVHLRAALSKRESARRNVQSSWLSLCSGLGDF